MRFQCLNAENTQSAPMAIRTIALGTDAAPTTPPAKAARSTSELRR